MAKIHDKNRSSIHEIVKKEKGICASFTVVPPAAEVCGVPQCGGTLG